MPSRSTRELLMFLLSKLPQLKTGLCKLIYRLYQDEEITPREYRRLLNHLQYRLGHISVYHWHVGKITPRLEWLETEIYGLTVLSLKRSPLN